MTQLEVTIAEVVGTVWESVLGSTIEPNDAIQFGLQPQHTYAGVVQIDGAWAGAVTVQCSEPMARRTAMCMFDIAAEDITEEELQDALGELTNMIGGNIKALLPGTCTLGIPVVVEGVDFRWRLPSSAPLVRSGFRDGDERVVVTLLERVLTAGAR